MSERSTGEPVVSASGAASAPASEPAVGPEAGAGPVRGLGRLRAWLGQREFARHVLMLMSGTAVAQALPIVTTPLLTRLYHSDNLAVFTIVMNTATMLIPVAALRYDMAIVLPEKDDDARSLVRITTILNTVTAVVVTVAMLFLAPVVAPLLARGNTDAAIVHHAQHWLLAVGLLVWAYAQLNILTYWLTRTKEFRLVGQNKVHQAVTLALGQFGLRLFGATPLGLVIGPVLGRAASLVNLVRKAQTRFWPQPGDQPASTRDLLREHVKMPLLNAPNALVDGMRMAGITWLIGIYWATTASGQPSAVANFGLAWTLLAAPIGLISQALSQVFFQRLSVTKPGRMLASVKRTILISAAAGVLPFLLIYFLAPPLLPPILGGSEYRLAGSMAAALVPWLFLNFITSPISMLFVVARRQATMLAFAIVYAAVPLALLTWQRHGDVMTAIRWMSWSQALLLVVFIVLAIDVARRFDRSGRAPDGDDIEVAEEEITGRDPGAMDSPVA